jgi:hypothetical protein
MTIERNGELDGVFYKTDISRLDPFRARLHFICFASVSEPS